MKVHVVCRAGHTDHILPRLARLLAEPCHYVVGDRPDAHADLNYFFPYLEWCDRGRDFHETPTAAWFTHRDTSQAGKAELWDEAAAAVDLRLTSARIFLPDLAEHGYTDLVTPPVDFGKFRPNSKLVPPDVPVIGVSGFVYSGGRKCEDLAARLEEARPDLHVVAAGKGWPVRNCKEWQWSDLHKFYQSLTIHVTTATLEGVPYPPLEALACGVPVVIPRGVGLLDDLSPVQGITRYHAGDFHSLCDAVDLTLSNLNQVNPLTLRRAVAHYNQDTWLNDHARAFENLLCPSASPEQLPPATYDNSGIYCVAFGDPSKRMARNLIASIHEHIPGLPACLVSDECETLQDVQTSYDKFVCHEDLDIGGRIAKISMYDLAPEAWQYVLYLDADTELVADVSVIFDWLSDGWQLVICKNPGKYHELWRMARPDNKEETDATFTELGGRDLLQLNGGVMAFRRCPEVACFFELWREEWERWGGRDQAALHRALWRQPLRVLVLGNEWNTVTRYDDPAITAGILHYPTTARRWKGRVDGRLDSEVAWAKVTA